MAWRRRASAFGRLLAILERLVAIPKRLALPLAAEAAASRARNREACACALETDRPKCKRRLRGAWRERMRPRRRDRRRECPRRDCLPSLLLIATLGQGGEGVGSLDWRSGCSAVGASATVSLAVVAVTPLVHDVFVYRAHVDTFGYARAAGRAGVKNTRAGLVGHSASSLCASPCCLRHRRHGAVCLACDLGGGGGGGEGLPRQHVRGGRLRHGGLRLYARDSESVRRHLTCARSRGCLLRSLVRAYGGAVRSGGSRAIDLFLSIERHEQRVLQVEARQHPFDTEREHLILQPVGQLHVEDADVNLPLDLRRDSESHHQLLLAE
mmetsp:Transcript_6734/g.15642  ORF Transcript_6734/g.15642 Transcript_6734/m.15642 type:complete len:325 (-) Transcript_6734:839-1813(-)